MKTALINLTEEQATLAKTLLAKRYSAFSTENLRFIPLPDLLAFTYDLLVVSDATNIPHGRTLRALSRACASLRFQKLPLRVLTLKNETLTFYLPLFK